MQVTGCTELLNFPSNILCYKHVMQGWIIGGPIPKGHGGPSPFLQAGP